MEPAMLYLITIVGVAGTWILGDRVWTLAVAVVDSDATPRIVRTVATAVTTLVLVAGIARSSPVRATVTPAHLRVVIDAEPDTGAGTTGWRWSGIDIVDDRPSGSRHGIASLHTVVRGDTLWRIAKDHLASIGAGSSGTEVGRYWRAIYETNRGVIGGDPNLILPGQVLELPPR
ncbi:MAG: LysM peptidoglycan-binding domain-containing protein [Acidimicrobiia bacterium]|nr:LysM peptidoglycan-binding domain-containing protein [Acidimicrobiia bacterium]